MLIVNGRIFGKDGVFRRGNIRIGADGRICEIIYVENSTVDEVGNEQVLDATGMYVIPGLVDIHLHGCAGYDFSDGTVEALEAIADFQVRNGVTSIVPATMTLPQEELADILRTAGDYIGAGHEVIKGITMEGPFISEKKKGAQNEKHILPPSVSLYKEWQQAAKGHIRQITVAPETEGAMDFVKEVSGETVVSLAHTAATYEQAKEAFRAGANHVTHLYNAMPAFGHRESGVIGAAFDEKNVFVELICDGEHIHPSVVRATFQMFGPERICMISDSMRATGMADGEYTLGGQPVWVKGSRAELEDGNLAASVTNLYDCMIRTVLEMGISLEEAVMACTLTPAKSLGLDGECGVLEAGRKADMVLLDAKFSRKYVFKNGQL